MIFSPSYPIEMLSHKPFQLDYQALKEAFGQRLGQVDVPDDTGLDKAFMFFLRDYPVELEDATVSAQLTLLGTDKPLEPERYQEALQQCWDIEDPAEALGQCRHSMVLVNMMSSSLPQHVRRQITARALLALMEELEVDLIYFAPAERLVDPQKLVSEFNKPDQITNPTYGFTNVRFYNIEGADGDMIMDTLGLGALGLTDLQIHYRDLVPGKVAAMMYSIAAYILENGDVIENGNTIQGLSPEDHWLCRHEMSLLSPERPVLDINPGPPFAAGNRR